MMRAWLRSISEPGATSQQRRDAIALLAAIITLAFSTVAFMLSKGTAALMPGPLASAHGAIEKCSTCHTESGTGKLTWVHGLVAGNPQSDSKACIACHKMPDTALNPHGASPEILKRSTERIKKIAQTQSPPLAARAQNVAFPMKDVISADLPCATCHQEHQGTSFKLNKLSNEQCQSCHIVKFDSFENGHPKFDDYPFKRRTRIIYDHAGHFDKHYPEVAKKEDRSKRIPENCATCHDTASDKRVMGVKPFDRTCASCHLDQITGKERATGPKGVAFLALPGLDIETLKAKSAGVGEWPAESEAPLTPFMKVMIGRNDNGRKILKAVDSLNLQDLATANESQVKAVTDLAWEIKSLFHAMILGKASDVLGNFDLGDGAKLSAPLVADLTASIPRDVLLSAVQQWLPNLAAEIANGKKPLPPTALGTALENATDAGDGTTESSNTESETDHQADAPPEAEEKPARQAAKRDPPPCLVRVLGQCLVSKEQPGTALPGNGAGEGDAEDAASAATRPPAMRAGLSDLTPAPEVTKRRTVVANADSARAANAAGQGAAKASNAEDELLFPTPEEQREIDARAQKRGGRAEGPRASRGGREPNADGESNAATSANAQGQPASVIAIESDIDAESWAEYGGWYRQDYAIYYRPTGHKDKFIYAWLFLTGPRAPKNSQSPATAVFDALTIKDAQGGCTKCHSIDEMQGKARIVNFSPLNAEAKRGSFTQFIHEPHFGTAGNRGCLTCHKLEKNQPYLKNYEQGDPGHAVSNFASVRKDTCQTCHQTGMARQDCLNCHTYHVNGALMPIMTTKIPAQ